MWLKAQEFPPYLWIFYPLICDSHSDKCSWNESLSLFGSLLTCWTHWGRLNSCILFSLDFAFWSPPKGRRGCHALFIFPELIQRWTPQYFCLSYDPFQPENKGVLMNRIHLCFVGQPFIALETVPSTSNNLKNISGTYKWIQNFQNLFPNRLILTDI